MIYLSIDVETTGLDQERYNILSIGAIIEDTAKKLSFEEIPKFHVAIDHKEVVGSLFAMNMNKQLIEYIARYQEADFNDREAIRRISGMQFLHEENVVEEFYKFIYSNGLCDPTNPPILTSKMKPTIINVAGKNFSAFDKKFLERLPHWKQAIRMRQKVADPAILFVDWNKDTELPGLFECKKRAGIAGIVTHNALEDAWDVIMLLRKFY